MTRSLAISGGLMGILLGTVAHAQPAPEEVLGTYADIAHAGYEDSLNTAKTLDEAVDALVADPSEATLKAALDA